MPCTTTAMRFHSSRSRLSPEADLGRFVGEAERIVGELEAIAGRVRDPEDGLVSQMPVAREYLQRVLAARDDRERLERIVLEDYPAISIGVGRKGSWEDDGDCQLMKDTVKDLRDLIKATRKGMKAQALADFLPLAERFVIDYTTRRRGEGHADYDDLLLWSRDLLRDNLEVRAYFQRRFRCLLVDEFQDTDPTQAELVMYICSDVSTAAGEKAARERHWYELPLRPGALFVVGDPKQSIYRFRRADMGVYDRIKNGPLRGGVVELSQNFRSLPGLIEWLNGAFNEIFVEKVGMQPPNIPLVATPGELELERSPVVVVRGEEPVSKATEVREQEARMLAAVIGRAVEKEHWQVRDQTTGEVRAAEYRDVAVLVPKRTEIDLYEDAFDDAGLPYRHEGNRSFYQRQEVKELAACLRAIDDPTDKLSLVTALRSSAFACSDEELFLFTAAGGWLDYLSKPPEGHEAVAGALSVLRGLHYDRGRTALPELVHRLVSRTHWAEFALTIPQGEQAAGNLLKVVDQARAFAGAGGGGLRAFARWLMTARDPAASDESEASVMEETDDVVRLMTIHNAKGLEFPIVALANFNSDPSHEQSTFLERESGRLNVTTWVGSFKTPGFEEAWEREKEHNAAEDLRTLYVACTRARDHLIVPVVPRANGDPRGLTGALVEFLSEERGCFLYDVGLPGRWRRGFGERPRDAGRPRRGSTLSLRSERSGSKSATLCSRRRRRDWRSCPRAPQTSCASALRVERRDDTQRIWAARSEAALVGTALHKVMELIDLEDPTNLETLARAICFDLGVQGHVEEVVGMARNCLASPTVRRATASCSYKREIQFDMALESRRLVGRADLLFVDEDGLVALDYKTDHLAVDEADSRTAFYSGQAESYVHGITQATGLPVQEVVFVFARIPVETAAVKTGERP